MNSMKTPRIMKNSKRYIIKTNYEFWVIIIQYYVRLLAIES